MHTIMYTYVHIKLYQHQKEEKTKIQTHVHSFFGRIAVIN